LIEQNPSVSGPVTSEQAASSARERRTMIETGLRDMKISWGKGDVQAYMSHKTTTCPFLYINCRFLIKMSRILYIPDYPVGVQGIMMGTSSRLPLPWSSLSSPLDFFATWST
jgi:hypothetical protein